MFIIMTMKEDGAAAVLDARTISTMIILSILRIKLTIPLDLNMKKVFRAAQAKKMTTKRKLA